MAALTTMPRHQPPFKKMYASSQLGAGSSEASWTVTHPDAVSLLVKPPGVIHGLHSQQPHLNMPCWRNSPSGYHYHNTLGTQIQHELRGTNIQIIASVHPSIINPPSITHHPSPNHHPPAHHLSIHHPSTISIHPSSITSPSPITCPSSLAIHL